MSLTERYRGTPYDYSLQSEVATHQSSVSKGRVLVIGGLIAGGVLYGIVLSLMGPF